MSPVKEYETGSGFILHIYSKDSTTLCNVLHKMGYIQGPTPIKFENIFTKGTITDTVVQHRYKATDMQFYWLLDQC